LDIIEAFKAFHGGFVMSKEVEKIINLGKLELGALVVRDPRSVRKRVGLPTLEEAIAIEKSLKFINPEANDKFVELLLAT
jgi:hypothetical protein